MTDCKYSAIASIFPSLAAQDDAERERRISVRMGREEAVRVERALRAAAARREQNAAAEAERERCLAICRQFPDNLMAREIARRIRGGK